MGYCFVAVIIVMIRPTIQWESMVIIRIIVVVVVMVIIIIMVIIVVILVMLWHLFGKMKRGNRDSQNNNASSYDVTCWYDDAFLRWRSMHCTSRTIQPQLSLVANIQSCKTEDT